MTKENIVLVAGPHRSGTSLFTRFLSLCGMDMGKAIMPPSYDNPTGFWENINIVAAHDNVLDEHGIDWTTAGEFTQKKELIQTIDIEYRLKKIFSNEFEPHTQWLTKDPRAIFFLKTWKKIARELDRQLTLTCLIRNPENLANSLAKRNNFDFDEALYISLTYLQRTLKVCQKFGTLPLVFEAMRAASGEKIAELSVTICKVDPNLLNAAFLASINQLIKRQPLPQAKEYNTEIGIKYAKLIISDSSLIISHNTMVTLDSYITGALTELSVKLKRDISPFKSFLTRSAIVPPDKTDEEVKLLDQKIIFLKKSIAQMQHEQIDVKNTVFDLSKENKNLSTVISEETFLTNTLKENITALTTKLEISQTELDKQKRSATANIVSQDRAIGALKKERDLSNAKISKRDGHINSLKTVISEEKCLANTLKENITTLTTKLDISQTELGKQKRSATAKIVSQDRVIGALKKERDLSNAEISKRDGHINSLKTVISEEKFLANTLKENITTLTTKLDISQTELGKQKRSATAKIVSQDRVIGALKKERDLSNAEILKRDGQIDNLIANQAELNAEISSLQRQLHPYQTKPLRTAIKGRSFLALRKAKNLLPLPANKKISLARKFTRLAQSLDVNHELEKQHGTSKIIPPKSLDIDFELPSSNNPVISIIIPVYNEIAQTIDCLRAVSLQNCSEPFEVILADDTSPDPLHNALKKVPGLRYFRNDQNLGFLNNCNQNAAHARGDYIVFLNNDTLVNSGWLEALYDTFITHNNVGIVGSKLIFPSGELQEAGGIIWEDASGWNWGRGESPEDPRYNYVRDADYVSGASFMILKSLWDEMSGFNTELEKAYYEDTDACFRARSLGYRVMYQPFSSLIHIEGLSSGTDLTSGAKQYQVSNQQTFLNTWKAALETHLPNATTPYLAADRKVKGHILYIDSVTPEMDKDSGSLDAFNTMQILTNIGYRVHFIPGTNFAHWGEATHKLQQMGVECIYHPFHSNIDSFLEDRGDMFAHVILSRAEICDLFMDTIKKKCPSAEIIYNTVDLHYLRLTRQAELEKDSNILAEAEAMKGKEHGHFKLADKIVVISKHEKSMLEAIPSLKDKLHVVPLVREAGSRLNSYAKRQDIVFIGGYRHPPNVDAVHWLHSEIWPILREKLPDARLLICGSHMPDEFYAFETDDFIIKGFVPDLNTLMASCRLTIAPLRYGAGLKGKIASSLGAGVPCVGTSIAYEGMGSSKGAKHIFKADTPKKIATLCTKLYEDESAWEKASNAGLAYHDNNFSINAVTPLIKKLLD